MDERRRIGSRVGEETTIASREKDREGTVPGEGGYGGVENKRGVLTSGVYTGGGGQNPTHPEADPIYLSNLELSKQQN